MTAEGGDVSRSRRPSPATDRGRVRLTRLRVVVALTLLLGVAQVLFEDAVLFIATTQGGVSGLLSTPLIAIGVPLVIATLLLAVLLGGALWTNDQQWDVPREFRPAADETGTMSNERVEDGADDDEAGVSDDDGPSTDSDATREIH